MGSEEAPDKPIGADPGTVPAKCHVEDVLGHAPTGGKEVFTLAEIGSILRANPVQLEDSDFLAADAAFGGGSVGGLLPGGTVRFGGNNVSDDSPGGIFADASPFAVDEPGVASTAGEQDEVVELPGGRIAIITPEQRAQRARDMAEWAKRDQRSKELKGKELDVWKAPDPSWEKARLLLHVVENHRCGTCSHSVSTVEAIVTPSNSFHYQARHFCGLITEDGGDSLEFEGPVIACSRYRPGIGAALNRWWTLGRTWLKDAAGGTGRLGRAITALRGE